MLNTTLCYIEKDNCYLMLYRNKKKEDPSAGKWIGVGGKFLETETSDECVLRETYEETGLTLTDYRLRGIVTFVSDLWESELMFLYTATGFIGELKECSEGELKWVNKKDVTSLPIWEGDKAIFKALDEKEDFFLMKVVYEGDKLVEVK